MKFNKFFKISSLLVVSIFLSKISINSSLNSTVQSSVSYLETFDISKLNLDDFSFEVSLNQINKNDQELSELNLNLIDKVWQDIWKQTFLKKFKNIFLVNIAQKINNENIILSFNNLYFEDIYLDSALTKKATDKDIIVGSTFYIKIIGQRELSGFLVIAIELV